LSATKQKYALQVEFLTVLNFVNKREPENKLNQ